jgi:L-fuconolactonase
MIDAHFHIWQPERADYGWLVPQLGPIYRDVSVGDWRGVSTPHGVTGGVLVQAAPTDAETQFLLGAAQASDAVLGVVGWVDMLAPDAVVRVERLAREPKLKALRPMLQDIADPDWILQSAVQPALAAMADCGLTFDALIKPLHLPRILQLALRHPALCIVVDHAAKPAVSSAQDTAANSTWAQGLAALACETQVFCKLSGLWTEAVREAPVQAVRDCACQVLELFGPKRVLWGSDWPVLELAGSYAAWHGFAKSVVPLAQHTDVFEATARRAYRM